MRRCQQKMMGATRRTYSQVQQEFEMKRLGVTIRGEEHPTNTV
jgi:hypothetical protein